MNNNKIILTTIGLFCLGFTKPVLSHSIIDIYNIAQKNDATIAQERELFNATKEEKYITRSELLPQIDASGSRSFNRIRKVGNNRRFYSKGYDIDLEQVIFDWEKWSRYKQSEPIITLAEKNWYQANQNLILRVAENYFNILNLQDNIEFLQKEYDATNEFYRESKEKFDLGVITVADIDQVKADLDAIKADLIVAKNDRDNNIETLREIINIPVPTIDKLKNTFQSIKLRPSTVDEWFNLARKNSLELKAAQESKKIASKDISISESNFMPKAVFFANLNGNDARAFTNNPAIQQDKFAHVIQVGVLVESPNLNPYGSIAEYKQAKANFHKADQELIETYRKVAKDIQNYYRAVKNREKEIAALDSAIKASQSALDSTMENFKLGTRTYVVVLDRISDLYSAKRDYRDAIYRYLIALLQLKNSAGVLDVSSLREINKLFANTHKIKYKKAPKPMTSATKTKPDKTIEVNQSKQPEIPKSFL